MHSTGEGEDCRDTENLARVPSSPEGYMCGGLVEQVAAEAHRDASP